MKKTITIEIEVEDFHNLYDDDDLEITDGNIEVRQGAIPAMTEKEFIDLWINEIKFTLEERAWENIRDEMPEEWDYPQNCCNKISIKMDNKLIQLPTEGT